MGLKKLLINFEEGNGAKIHSILIEETVKRGTFKDQMLALANEKGLAEVEIYLTDVKMEETYSNAIILYCKNNLGK